MARKWSVDDLKSRNGADINALYVLASDYDIAIKTIGRLHGEIDVYVKNVEDLEKRLNKISSNMDRAVTLLTAIRG